MKLKGGTLGFEVNLIYVEIQGSIVERGLNLTNFGVTPPPLKIHELSIGTN